MTLKSKSNTGRGDGPDPGKDQEVFLTERQLAARYQRSVKTLRNLRVRGNFIEFVKIGRHVRYPMHSVLAYEEQRTFTSTSQPTVVAEDPPSCGAHPKGGRDHD